MVRCVRESEGPMNVAQRLSDIDVLDLQGQPVRMGSLWADRPVVLVFIRHFG